MSGPILSRLMRSSSATPIRWAVVRRLTQFNRFRSICTSKIRHSKWTALITRRARAKCIDVSAEGKHVFTEAFDGQSGWQWEGKGEQKPATEKATAALRHGVELPGKLFGLHEIKARGHRMKSIGREQIDGVNYYALQLILNDGYAVSLYADPDTWLVTRRRDVRPLHVDVDPTPTTIEQVSSDFRDVNGVKFPFVTTETDLNTGKLLESATTKSVEINPTLPSTLFDKL
jgi:hypothetical protein